jgi:signal peptidase II
LIPLPGAQEEQDIAAADMRRARWRFFAIAGVIVLFDQLSKAAVRGWLVRGESWPADAPLLGVYRFTHVHNTGMAFGLGQGRSAVFLVVAVLVVVLLSVWQWRLPAAERWLRIALAMQVGGAVGNAIDRVHQGHVTDFFDFLVFPVFNIADSAISIGVALLAWQLWRVEAAAMGDPGANKEGDVSPDTGAPPAASP